MIVVGVDGGGTKTRATAVECVNGKGKVLGTYETEGSNFHNVGIRRASQRIREAVTRSANDQFPDLVVLGLAGLDSKYDYQVLWENLNDVGKEVIMDNDSFFLLYSETGGGKGVITISGTGSIVLGMDGERKVRAEGAGWFLSDTGSAYWVGREALRYLSKTLQGMEKETPLVKMIMKTLKLKDIDDLIYWVYHRGHRIERVASIAKIVDRASRKGDDMAKTILLRGSKELGEISAHVARQINVRQVYVVGGMFNSRVYMKGFRETLTRWKMEPIKTNKDPSIGSLMFGLNKVECKLD
ncbi:BadF/BadG/BcrA/BcrD ATPase family protein [Metallosphaera hakonensis]|uniref:Hexokinase n=1 Tax=Metallosphaera hakonensis JCM 8857 = DSM 7519 TaxID=1293036 RepID=A0A2U9IW42_9CREN|nr:BadF/BadG/BcrA/BcrD ATPase family protein [Metallosphaera hakonensis]AWS00226.1 hexokinase [Metallosphaera hakonensis JCM 8857 = DSM 7519]